MYSILTAFFCRLFDHKYHNREVNIKLEEYNIIHVVDGFPGIEVDCGSTPCIFEMIAYKYVGKIIHVPKVNISPFPLMSTGIACSQPHSSVFKVFGDILLFTLTSHGT